MFKVVFIFFTIIFYKILANKFNFSIQEKIMQSNIIVQSKTKLVTITYNIIYFYSVCQIKCNRLYNKVSHYLEMFKTEDNLVDDIKTQTIELFDLDTNKNRVFTKKEQQVFDLFQSSNNLLIISDKTNIDKKIVDKKNIDIDNSSLEISNITFIALYLNYNNERYNINLKTKEFNYYLVGNIINKQFVQYYINNILKIPFYYTDKQIISYQLELMDHEVNMISLNADQFIIIEINGYRIENSSLSEEITEEEEDEGEIFKEKIE
jgi:hypothetical protein